MSRRHAGGVQGGAVLMAQPPLRRGGFRSEDPSMRKSLGSLKDDNYRANMRGCRGDAATLLVDIFTGW